MAMREEVYEILPFILDISNDTFESQKLTKLSMLPGRFARLLLSWPGRLMTLVSSLLSLLFLLLLSILITLLLSLLFLLLLGRFMTLLLSLLFD